MRGAANLLFAQIYIHSLDKLDFSLFTLSSKLISLQLFDLPHALDFPLSAILVVRLLAQKKVVSMPPNRVIYLAQGSYEKPPNTESAPNSRKSTETMLVEVCVFAKRTKKAVGLTSKSVMLLSIYGKQPKKCTFWLYLCSHIGKSFYA
jgi:hypothetical protein